jgi:hypothetical protein
VNRQSHSNDIIFLDIDVIVWFQRLVSADEIVTVILRSILTEVVRVHPIQFSRIRILPPNLDKSLMNWIISDETLEICGIVTVVQLADVPTAFSRMVQVKVHGARVYLLVTLVITHTAHAATGSGGSRCTKLYKHCMV